MRKIVAEFQAPEIPYNHYRFHELLQCVIDGDKKVQLEILSDTADPQVGRKAERLCPECLKAYDYKKEMSLQWVCEHCGYRTDAEEAGE